MAETKIEWADYTFNPWWGCQRVSPACEHCYAETFDKRIGGHHWGPPEHTPRRFFGDSYWQNPIKWNAAAVAAGVEKRVFCASMADVFESGPVPEGSEGARKTSRFTARWRVSKAARYPP